MIILNDENLLYLASKHLHESDQLKYNSCLTNEEKLEKQIQHITNCIKKQLDYIDNDLDERIERVVRKVLSEREEN